MNVRQATPADRPLVAELLEAYAAESTDAVHGSAAGVELIAEDHGQAVGVALASVEGPTALVQLVYVTPERRGAGVGRRLLGELTEVLRTVGAEEVRIEVGTDMAAVLAHARRLGFADRSLSLSTDLEALGTRLAAAGTARSSGAVHVQTDDQNAVQRAVSQFVPQLFRSRSTVITAPDNGWIAVYDELAGREPKLLLQLAAELSYVTGAIVFSIGVEAGEVVRYAAFDRGQNVDEYLSVPEFYGPLPPGDVIGLRANRTLLARLTGADPARVREVARTAAAAAELPQPRDHVRELGELLGIPRADLNYEEAAQLPGSVAVEHP